ncbi:META domain-containing protein [Streptomyces sp. NPDC006879]|uniref:META domain-containing protein n=1 Tax=Streptomyces sp. NPDC006879 TaxID=3364767 RepID=UPI0036A2E1CE
MRTLRLTLAALAATLPLAACGSATEAGDDAAPGAGNRLVGTRWAVQELTEGGKRLPAPTGAHLLIEGDRARGNNGCNTFESGVRVGRDLLTVTPGSVTERGCAGAEQAFEAAFQRLFSGDLRARGSAQRLQLTTAEGDVINLKSTSETPQDPKPLVGTRWKLTTLYAKDAATALPAEVASRAFLKIGPDGAVQGDLGCNTLTSQATVFDTTVSFGLLATTTMSCPGPVDRAEESLGRVLQSGPLHYRIEGGELRLTAKDGDLGLGAVAAK